ncbi:MAG: acyltransferase family protein [Planctomycetes bacterium]|nr:acyltransferase family protein [Planctomycetota bacterium]
MTKKGDGKSVDSIVFFNAIFIIIILYHHSGGYMADYLQFLSDYKFMFFFQKLAVGGFLFLSGYKLVKSKLSVSVFSFIRNRLVKIYPPYLAALIAFSFTDYPYIHNGSLPTIKNFILHALCLQSIFPGFSQANYRTLWFVSVLFCCYLFFLAARKIVKHEFAFLFLALAVVAAAAAGRYFAAGFDIDIFQKDWGLYLLFFAGGMFFAAQARPINLFFKNSRKRAAVLLAVSVLNFFLLVIFYNFIYANSGWQALAEYALVLLSAIPIYLLVFSHEDRLAFPSVFAAALSHISRLSFFIFLFHRPVWAILQAFWYSRTFWQWLFMVLAGLPLIFFTAYFSQNIYRRFLALWRG